MRGYLALLVTLALAGCSVDGEGQSTGDSEPAPIGRYAARTEGPTEALLAHLDDLERTFRETEELGPRQARQATLNFQAASAETAAAALARADLSAQQAFSVANITLPNLARAASEDPSALGKIFAICDDLVKRYPNTPTATFGALFKVNTLASAPEEVMANSEERFEQLVEAALLLGRLEPAHPSTPDILAEIAPGAEQLGKHEAALALYQLLAERFKDSPKARYAPGNVRRLSMLGKPVEPTISGPSLDGLRQVSLDDYRGKVVLVDFWATFCGPCVEEFPVLKSIRDKLGTDRFEVLGVCLDKSALEAATFLKKFRADWPQLSGLPSSDSEFTSDNELVYRFGAEFIPLKLLVGADGTLLATGHSLREMRPTLESLFPGELPPITPLEMPLQGISKTPLFKSESAGDGAQAGTGSLAPVPH